MKRISTLLAGALLCTAPTAWALNLGTNITTPDGKGSGTGWHGAQEDQEVEPGMVGSQAWDLEAFLLKGNILSLVGGYNFRDGQTTGLANPARFYSGDIFLDTDGTYGAAAAPTDFDPSVGTHTVQGTFGYEYVLALTFGVTNTYEIYALDRDSFVTTAYYQQNESGTSTTNPGSNPWRHASDGSYVGAGTFTFTAGLGNTAIDGYAFLGGTHYALSGFDLSFLAEAGHTSFTSHFTMECGNDNLMGSGTLTPVPEPATLLLLGTGLTALAGVARRRTHREA